MVRTPEEEEIYQSDLKILFILLIIMTIITFILGWTLIHNINMVAGALTQ